MNQVNVEEKNICLNCDKFKNKSCELLKEYDSVYDAALEMKHFIEKCKKNCDAKNTNKIEGENAMTDKELIESLRNYAKMYSEDNVYNFNPGLALIIANRMEQLITIIENLQNTKDKYNK